MSIYLLLIYLTLKYFTFWQSSDCSKFWVACFQETSQHKLQVMNETRPALESVLVGSGIEYFYWCDWKRTPLKLLVKMVLVSTNSRPITHGSIYKSSSANYQSLLCYKLWKFCELSYVITDLLIILSSSNCELYH